MSALVTCSCKAGAACPAQAMRLDAKSGEVKLTLVAPPSVTLGGAARCACSCPRCSLARHAVTLQKAS